MAAYDIHQKIRVAKSRIKDCVFIGKPAATRRVMSLLNKMLIYSTEFTVWSKESSLIGRWLKQVV
jgi:hypothetical protein